MRYAGKPAAFLRGFRAVYLGLLMNCLILGWVTKAMTSIVGSALGKSEAASLAICIFFLIPFTGFYVSLGGLWGVLWTDLFQFVLKMAIVIAVAYFGVKAAGGMHAMLRTLAHMRIAAGPGAADITAMFPDFSRGLTTEALWTLPVLTFLVHLSVQWWAFWYPGSEPGGGGYIAQRIFSARDERHGLLSVLWFNIAHYAVRPWPWILTALAAAALYPGLQHPETGYMLVATSYMPHALRGILIAGFMAAFMSTIATQLNWGSSYLVEDFYRRFIRRRASEKHYVNISRIATLLLVAASAYVSAQLATISQGWEVVLEVGAGTGGVYLLRWYWWRINAWSEISAMATALAMTLIQHRWSFFVGSAPVLFAKATLTTTTVTTVVWVLVTLLTPAEPDDVLLRFYLKVRPHVAGWRRIAALAPETPQTRDLGKNLLAWALGSAMVYAALFGIGKLFFGQTGAGMALLALAVVCAMLLYRDIAERATAEPTGGVGV
jgi:Na+/proline symporter